MKRFWLVLLSLGLIAAFSGQAMAVDVKFSGEYYAAGLYLDRTTVVKDSSASYVVLPTTRTALAAPVPTPYGLMTHQWAAPTSRQYTHNLSTAFYFQRLRLNTTFIVSPGLMLTTRADIMERAWGAGRSSATIASLDSQSAGTTAENENIAFDLTYVTYISPIGIFLAGYQIDGAWGTVFGDSSDPTAKISYIRPIGPVKLGVQMGKNNGGENSVTAKNPTGTNADLDNSFYTAFGVFSWKTGQAGLLFKHINARSGRMDTMWFPYVPALSGLTRELPFQSSSKLYIVSPYAKAQLGPVALQAQAYYLFWFTLMGIPRVAQP